MTRGRSARAGGLWADEANSETLVDLLNRVSTLEQDNEDNSVQTLTGVPQAQGNTTSGAIGPGNWCIAVRVDTDGLIYPTFQFTSLATTLRRFWIYLRKVKRNGTYGKHLDQRVIPTAADIAGNHIEVDFQTGLSPNFRYDLVLVEAKLTGSASEDGGSRDTDPDPYVEKPAPDGTQLATVNVGAGQTGSQVTQFAQNSKFKFGSASWRDVNGTDDNGPLSGGPLTDNDCAKWRYALDNNRGLNANSANINYWRKSGAFPATMNLASSNSTFDPCSRMQGSPFDPGEKFNVAFSGILNGQFAVLDLAATITCTLIDDGLPAGSQVVATTSYPSVGAAMSRSEWRTVQMPEATCLESWVPVGRQWVRWHLDTTLTSGRSFIIDKVLYSQMQGAYSRHPNDLAQTQNPQAQPTGGNGRGAAGYGSQSGNFPPGTAGVYRPSTD